MKKIIKVLFVLLILLIAIFIYSYFHVEGKEIQSVSSISSECSIIIRKSNHFGDNAVEYNLNAKQIDMLKSLLLESKFTRVLSSTVVFQDQDKYLILIDFNNNQHFLTIDSIGNEFISIPNQFDGKHLKINNPNWGNSLEEIIEFSN